MWPINVLMPTRIHPMLRNDTTGTPILGKGTNAGKDLPDHCMGQRKSGNSNCKDRKFETCTAHQKNKNKKAKSNDLAFLFLRHFRRRKFLGSGSEYLAGEICQP